MVGYQQYRPDGLKTERKNPRKGRYFTYVSKEATGHSKLAVWGLDFLRNNQDTVYVVEGVFKACRFHNLGLNAVAVLGADPKPLTEWLWSSGFKTVAVCDGDVPGRKLAKHSRDAFFLLDGLYLDEMSTGDFKSLVEQLEN